MVHFVVGFLFSEDFKLVALIEKLKPSYLAGKLNGLGGKVEPGESPAEAMRREFQEEGGLLIPDWRAYARVSDSSNFIMDVFFAVGPVHLVQAMETEKVFIVPVESVLLAEAKTVGNVPFLVAMALGIAHKRDNTAHYNVKEVF